MKTDEPSLEKNIETPESETKSKQKTEIESKLFPDLRDEAIKKASSRSFMGSARIGALIFFGAIAVWFFSGFIDLVINTTILKHHASINETLLKYVIMPISFEFGFFVMTLIILYMMGRFTDLPLKTSVISMYVMVHVVDGIVKYVLSQFSFYYASYMPWLYRLPGALLTFVLGYYVLKIALKRE